jgi:hypothetical protein
MDRNQPKGVKRIVVVAMMALMSFTTAVGQDIYSGSTSLVVINSEWENVTLSGVKDGSLIAMLDCFNKKWPTWMVTHALKTMRKGQHLERYGEGLPTVFYEPQNGWVDVAAQPMGTEFIHVCYWKRTNGHRLFAKAYRSFHPFRVFLRLLSPETHADPRATYHRRVPNDGRHKVLL